VKFIVIVILNVSFLLEFPSEINCRYPSRSFLSVTPSRQSNGECSLTGTAAILSVFQCMTRSCYSVVLLYRRSLLLHSDPYTHTQQLIYATTILTEFTWTNTIEPHVTLARHRCSPSEDGSFVFRNMSGLFLYVIFYVFLM